MTPQQLAEQVDLDHGIFTREEEDQVRKEIADVICSAVAEERAIHRQHHPFTRSEEMTLWQKFIGCLAGGMLAGTGLGFVATDMILGGLAALAVGLSQVITVMTHEYLSRFEGGDV